MHLFTKYGFVFFCWLAITVNLQAQVELEENHLAKTFYHPPEQAKPWVFWYWMNGCVSREGITADLEAMRDVGIGGAYLMTIKDTSYKIDFQPQVRQLTPEWFAMIAFAKKEAVRLGIKLGIHVSDGFALAGGPWITPAHSMQKVVWSKTYLPVGTKGKIILPQPETNENFYEDIAVYAYPANYKNELANQQPEITCSNGTDAAFLNDPANKKTFRSDTACWIQYRYTQPVTIRQVKIKKQNNAYQSQRFILQKSMDGIQFTTVDTLHPPLHGWQDAQEPYTHAVKTFQARAIRFVWNKKGSLPGSENLDAAKWKPVLRVQGIFPSDEPVIHNYEAKNGSVWRLAATTTAEQVTVKDIIPLQKITDLTRRLNKDGSINWTPPAVVPYCIVRIGHTSTGLKNETGGGAKGLEADKFSAVTVKKQYQNWFEKIVGTDSAKAAVQLLHIDSWECGSQNWGEGFVAAFRQKRGYDLMPYLLLMTGTPLVSLEKSEAVLADIRQTIAELVNDKFFGTLKQLAHAKNFQISAESIAPTFVSDGLLHYKNTDIPMGEFWQNSPTHDKPNDLLDAISGAHIYGKSIVQAEAFTTLRMNWKEHPGSMKTLGDRIFATGINKMVLHVFVHNPWIDRAPGMTLDGIGLYFQRNQTWFAQSKAWISYLTRCQALLQTGKPVVDIAVFNGANYPQRSLLPEQLIPSLPGLFGKERVLAEKKRLQNEGTPLRAIPDGVTHSANMADPEKDVNCLNGYQYDCFNTDVLLTMTVKNKIIYTPGGASYKILVFPGPIFKNGNKAVLNKIKQLALSGAVILANKNTFPLKGNNVYPIPFQKASFEHLGIPKDVDISGDNQSIAWVHRKTRDADIYFFANQIKEQQNVKLTFPMLSQRIDFFDPVNDFGLAPKNFTEQNGKTELVMQFEPNQSMFIVLEHKGPKEESASGEMNEKEMLLYDWQLEGMNEKQKISKQIETPESWTEFPEPEWQYYSGTVNYTKEFWIDTLDTWKNALLKFDQIRDIATITINGIDCGTLWTYPFTLNVTKALRPGKNLIKIAVTNTWHNKLIGDHLLAPEKRTTFTTAPFYLKDKPLEPAGITGWVKLILYGH